MYIVYYIVELKMSCWIQFSEGTTYKLLVTTSYKITVIAFGVTSVKKNENVYIGPIVSRIIVLNTSCIYFRAAEDKCFRESAKYRNGEI